MESLQAIFTETLGLNVELFEEFQKELRIKNLKKKEFLIQEGAVCDFIALVISGTLRSYVQNNEGEFNNDFYLENSFVSAYTSFLTQMPTNCNIEALTNAKVYYITHKQFNSLIERDNNFLKLAKYISDNYFIRKCKRETSFLKNSAAERLEMIRILYPGIEQKVPQYHIASYLGIKPESLSRIKLLTYINK
ncbi:Crp/Fnr family transcriptional regulator [Flavobacterium psychroterrae]|uniref:Crp/Fnr family transcriptional regulator n=1 Tax=Flavobacterium psychroterrae TaxID=2133767 RepID=A0ABS5PDE0_9FLAO|nr:Crp/Fnr family transcriptional regulator [Flavobacterium psychroterrae]MBS7232317.1 Crp/Fnr family transcriptional regulator [Flavobacterium psychroterrae]